MFATIEERFYRLDYEASGKGTGGSTPFKENGCSQSDCSFIAKIIEAENFKVANMTETQNGIVQHIL